MNQLNVAFMGTPGFSVAVLELLYQKENINLTHVITMPDRPSGRGKKLTSPPVADFAKKKNLHLIQTANINQEEGLLESLRAARVDMVIVIAFAQFLGQPFLDVARLGAFNIHTSLLPKYRGAAPIHYALLKGDTKTGVSIQKMVKKMDAGDIYWQDELEIKEDDDIESLFARLAEKSVHSLEAFLDYILAGKDLASLAVEQNEEKVSFAPEIKKDEAQLDFTTEGAKEVVNKWRAFKRWPGVSTSICGKRVKLIEVNARESKMLAAKEVQAQSDRLLIGTRCGDLEVKALQPEGKRAMSIRDYLNGLQDKKLRIE